MVEVIGDPVIPSTLVLPDETGKTQQKVSGAVWLSGGKINFWTGSGVEIVDSS